MKFVHALLVLTTLFTAGTTRATVPELSCTLGYERRNVEGASIRTERSFQTTSRENSTLSKVSEEVVVEGVPVWLEISYVRQNDGTDGFSYVYVAIFKRSGGSLKSVYAMDIEAPTAEGLKRISMWVPGTDIHPSLLGLGISCQSLAF